MLTQIHINQNIKKSGVGMVRDGCGQPGHRTLKLTVPQE